MTLALLFPEPVGPMTLKHYTGLYFPQKKVELYLRNDNIVHSQVSNVDFSHLENSVGQL